MIDCGVGEVFIDQNFTKNFEQRKMDCPLTAKNVDGTINKKGTIKSYVDLEFKIDSRKRAILHHWIRKTKDYPWFSLAPKA